MATGAKEVSGRWRVGRKRAGVCEASSASSNLPGHLALSKAHLPLPDADTPIRRDADTFPLLAVLMLAASLLLSACAAADNGAKNDPVLFGGAGGGNGGAGATSGVSVSW
jgi:hypothetical protein